MGNEIKSSDIQLLKTPSGDAMLLVHIDKESLKTISKLGAGIVVTSKLKDIPKIQCLARYDRFFIREDLIIQPEIQRIR